MSTITHPVYIVDPLVITPQTLPNVCDGSVYPTQTFTVTGGTPPYTWIDVSSPPLPSALSFNPSTQQLTGTAHNPSSTYDNVTLQLEVTDSGSQTAFRSFTLTIYTLPVIVTTTLSDAINGTPYSDGISATLGNYAGPASQPYLTDIGISSGSLPNGLSLGTFTPLGPLDPNTIAIVGTPSALAGVYNFVAEATDSHGCVGTYPLSITVQPIVISTSSLPGSCRGVSYSQTLTTNGVAPNTWSILSGALPTSLSLDTSTGVISGTIDAVATPGTYFFNVHVVDSLGNTANQSLNIIVHQEPIWVSNILPGGPLLSPYSVQLNATGAVTYTLQSGALPDGTTLSSGGLISGTPTVIAVFPFTIRATDTHGCYADKALSITISNFLPVLTGTFVNVCNSTNYLNSLVVTGGTPPYTFAVTAGALPQQLVLNPVSGDVQGITSEPGVFTFDITVTDSLNLSNTTSFGFTVYDSPIITDPAMPPGVLGRPYSYTFISTHGTSPRIWVLYGILPSGLVFNSIYGTISGTPTEFGYFPITIGIQDANTCSNTKDAAIIIAGPPEIVTTGLPPACQSQDYGNNPVVSIVVTGGIPPYYWFIVSDNFPPQDLILNPYTGQLSGIPLIAGSYPFTVKVVDQNNLYTTQDYTLVVRTTAECGQPDEGQTVTITKTRLTSLESDPVIVADPFHQKHLQEYLPTPFITNE